LTNTINLKNKPFPQVPGVPPAQVIVPNILLPANAPPGSQWGLATAVQNAGAGTPNASTANAPGPAQSNLPRLLVHTKSLLPAESPRANPTSFASVWKSWSVRKRWTEYASSGDAPSQIAVVLVC